ncbi:MAG: hypothetical protein FWE45_01080 [Firmicutes bacterium]|nr:hypothetical protein [Bacillota bacterium]
MSKKVRLTNLAIYELRNLARSVGVERPSSMSRSELTSAIRAKQGTSEKPDINACLAADAEVPCYLQLLEQDDLSSCETVCTSESFSNYGFVLLLPNGSSILISRDLFTYKICTTLTSSHKLQMGDSIEVVAKIDKGLRKVIEIKNVETYNATKVKCIVPHIKSSIWDNEFTLGSRILVLADKTYNRVGDIAKFQNPNVYRMALLIEENDESVEFLCNNKIDETFLVKVDMPTRKQVALCLYALFSAKRLAYSGKSVIFFIDSLSKMWRIYSKCAAKDELVPVNMIHIGAMADLKKYFMAPKALEKGGDLSIVGFVNNPTSEVESYIYDELSNLANLIITK